MNGALPTFVVIGAMKCGTTALHHMLGAHPDIAMSDPKELNFFFGTTPPPIDAVDPWAAGNWWRGVAWYARHFPPHAPVRGESSPGYTSPDHPDVAGRLAATVPDVRLVYLVRDPIDRAVSQYLHHHRDGTEARPPADALLDPASQYVERSRYHERLTPFLDHVPPWRMLVVAMEDLRDDPATTLARLLAFLGAGPPGSCGTVRAGAGRPRNPAPQLHERLATLVRDDVARLRALTRQRFARWSV